MVTEAEDKRPSIPVQNLQEALRLGLAVVTELWSYSVDDWIAGVHAADIDGDGEIEILVASRDGSLYVLTRTGDFKWKTSPTGAWVGAVAGIDEPYVASMRDPIGNANQTRIIVGVRNNKVYGLNKNNQILWQYPAEGDIVVRQMIVGDIDGDGELEVILGSEDRYIHALASRNGECLWTKETGAWVRTVCIADLDGDGKSEVIAGSGDYWVYVLDGAGQLKQKYYAGAKIYTMFVADIDDDGEKELLIGTDAKDLYALTSTFQQKWVCNLNNRVLSLFVGDLNNDGRQEILAGSEDKHLYILSSNGEVLWRHNVDGRVFDLHVSDINRDGWVEVLVGAEDNNVHCLHIELLGNEQAKILDCYEQLHHPPLSVLNLSPTEGSLLMSLVGEQVMKTVASAASLNDLPLAEDLLERFSLLLTLEEQKVYQLWSRNVGYIRAIELGQVVDDEREEILVGTSEGAVKALDTEGNLLWQWTDPAGSARIRSLQVGDVNHDNQAEVIVCSAGGQVYILDCQGNEVERAALNDWITSLSIVSTHPFEMVMGSEESRLIYRYQESLSNIPTSFPAPQGIQVVQAHDINEDGEREILAGAVDYNVYAYSRLGELLWTYQTRDRVRALYVMDIDGDGHKEIIVGSEDRSTHVLDDQGYLKWRYYAPHRVLDVYALDINQDNRIEVVLACGDGYLYVLDHEGNLLWSYYLYDRIRVVRIADIDLDGKLELIAGTEDRLYLLRMLDLSDMSVQIEICWDQVQQRYPLNELLRSFITHRDPILRSFAIKYLVGHPDLLGKYLGLLQDLITDPAASVRLTFARVIPAFFRVDPDQVRRFFDILSGDREREVRLAFVDSLPAIIAVRQDVGFAYFERLTSSVDMWVRRAVVRKLHSLAAQYPQQVSRLLLIAVQDNTIWIYQEAARSLARYFDLHPDSLIEGVRLLGQKPIELAVYELIVHRAVNPAVREVFRVLVNLFTNLSENTIQANLKDAVDAFEHARDVRHGLEIWQVYRELYRLVRMHTVDEIARYKCSFDDALFVRPGYFDDTVQIMHRLETVAGLLAAYLRREGLRDRLASLLEAIRLIEALYADVKSKLGELPLDNPFFLDTTLHRQSFSDRAIIFLFLRHWRSLLNTELGRLAGRAQLHPELLTKTQVYEDQVSFWLAIHNSGDSPADEVQVALQPGEGYTIISAEICELEMVPSRESVQVEFTIQPHCEDPHLIFQLFYNDVSEKGRTLDFGDRLQLRVVQNAFQRVLNPYSVGMPIRSPKMFYGREGDQNTIVADLVNSAANMAVVLYGQRRTGKTSLLYQLVNTPLLEPHVPVYIDMQSEALGITIGKFLRSIAYTIHRTLKERGITVRQPGLRAFKDDPTFIFSRFLDEVHTLLGDERKIILLIDEFEILEKKVDERALPREIFEYLRSLMQHRHNMSFLFAGTHTIMELTSGYWSVFFNIAQHRRLTKLGGAAAKRLIVKPVAASLEYDEFAIKKIRNLAADQPYLIQLICYLLVEHCNTRRKNYVTINDVNMVLDDVMKTGEIHFMWIWDQIDQQERLVFAILAQVGGEELRWLSLPDIEERYRSHALLYNQEKVLQALRGLCSKDIVEGGSGDTHFRIVLGLAQRWLREKKDLRRVILEEGL
jgi:outer membrane protein assembly factor BamB